MSSTGPSAEDRPGRDLAGFLEYHRTGDRQQRDALVLEHADLAGSIARRFADRGESMDDLRQVAMLGLLKAVERFDPTRGVAFSTFATPTIEGELKRHFRGQWSVRVPRGLQEAVLEVNRSVSELAHDLGRSPTIDEVARATGRSPEAVLEAMEAAGAYRGSSLDRPTGDDDDSQSVSDTIGEADPHIGQVDARLTVAALLDTLPDRERQIVELRFYDQLSQSEIAARIGVSQMHVSRLLARALDRLRAWES